MSAAVSIILPTCNRLEYLRPAVDSIAAQTFADWELIIADDGSNAETKAYLEGLHDPPRIRVIWLAHSGRPSVVRNAALRHAQGEFIAFLDSDDLWLPRKLEVQVASLRNHPARHWSYTKFGLVNGSGSPIAPTSTRSWPTPTGWILEPLLKGETVIGIQTVIVSRRLLEQLGAFDEDLVMCEDDELCFRLAEHSEADGVDEPLTLIRRHGQHGGSDILAWQDRRRVFEKALRASRGGHLIEPILRRLRAEMSVGLAKSQAVSGMRADVLSTLASSAHYSWPYLQWWSGALSATARAFAPQYALTLLRRYRRRHRVPNP